MYNTEGVPFSSEKTKNCFCVIKIRNIILTITHRYISGAVEATQSLAKAGSRAKGASTLKPGAH